MKGYGFKSCRDSYLNSARFPDLKSYIQYCLILLGEKRESGLRGNYRFVPSIKEGQVTKNNVSYELSEIAKVKRRRQDQVGN